MKKILLTAAILLTGCVTSADEEIETKQETVVLGGEPAIAIDEPQVIEEEPEVKLDTILVECKSTSDVKKVMDLGVSTGQRDLQNYRGNCPAEITTTVNHYYDSEICEYEIREGIYLIDTFTEEVVNEEYSRCEYRELIKFQPECLAIYIEDPNNTIIVTQLGYSTTDTESCMK